MLRKYISDPSHVLEEQPVELEADFTYVEQPVQILDWKTQVLRSREIQLVKVLWRSHTVEKATWEPEDQMREQLPSVYVAFGYDDVHGHPGCLQFVSALDIRLTSFGDAGTVRARNADQADYGPLNPASLRLGLTLCHRDLPGELTDYRELTDIRN
ncbi:hypothetical protein L3X38_025409 [Prunus dulcis]|uniref:Chromo domain-containing protein n=1 Tax=Prunus dulcis TaxID=3755 RepID=A0AAD4W2F4_PRUDU|nr:hypothetical protein L3X38_025409 [Prunus dulcis]